MGLDLKAIARSIWQPLGIWVAMVLVVAFGGRQPGVVCMTPVAWLLALWVGILYSASSRATTKGSRLIGAAVAGAAFGALQGALFAVVAPYMGDIKSNEQQKALMLTIIMVVAGAAVCALLSVATAAAQEKRRNKTPT